ncbi:hypothetical protein ANN_12316, partial [Periplaneta americana]
MRLHFLLHRKLPSICSYWVEGKPRKKLNQVTCPDRDSNPGHLVSRPDALTVTPQVLEFLSLRVMLERGANMSVEIWCILHAYAMIGILNCVDAALVPLHTTERMRLSSYKKCFRVALIVSNGRNKAQLTLVLLPQSLMLAGSEFQSLGRAIVKEDEYEESLMLAGSEFQSLGRAIVKEDEYEE